MNNNNFFCSQASINQKDNLIGTASFYSRLILIEYNRPFKSEALTESNIPCSIRNILDDFSNIHPNTKVLLIKKGKNDSSRMSIFGLTTSPSEHFFNHFQINDYEEISLDFLENLFQEKHNNFNKKLYLICTNGTKDKCCSKFGLPIYKEFQKQRQHQSWQCTHLGGDRFAPTALVLPSFSTYGHIEESDVKHIIELEEKNAVHIPRLRGNSHYNFYEQAADILMRKKYSLSKLTDIKVLNSSKLNDVQYEVLLMLNLYDEILSVKIIVEKQTNNYFNFMTCNSTRKSYSFEYKIINEKIF